MEIGFHASHEQFPPSRLLGLARRAEAAGFAAVLSSDHVAPWSERQGQSGFAWTWLGAAMAQTSLPYGVVTAVGGRYHPVVVAQAVATLAEMFPGRFAVALGSGQALNEHVTGQMWPRKPVRNARLRECADIVRRLLAGRTVDHDGLVTVRAARVHTLPERRPPLLAAALTPQTAREVASWADGLVTVNAPLDRLRQVIDAFREGGGEGRPVHVQVHLSWAENEELVRAQAVDQWRLNALPPMLNEELELPEQFDAATAHIPGEALRSSVVMSADPRRHAEVLASYADLGVERVYLHQVGLDQERFLDVFGERVLTEVNA
ncbi:TIGR03885 family FMN-dependent LLM class oxidoreductase [Thermobifida halotolerans]|uniref:TIGR03885 family FMN-dependent LLM class oxidoreductase n=1 Tax=Thermobifida halotolerans TaxID=483545 RepID=A0A399G9L0_9ACTN|nr:TIGR03885 family FMN-dependent LLM class oxidoreductase [Thermobifida halotolerans]UOE21187.1 TIGR03885 family FMN-dependent LLM class oxidoreductase [Thermobifida halotolerans]